MLVIDANVARAACGGEGDGFAVLGDELASIPLMWSEARASLHLQLSKGEIGRGDGESSTTALKTARSTESIHLS